MKKKGKRIASLLLVLVIFIAGIPAAELELKAEAADAANREYEIYPVPQAGISYGTGTLELGDTANMVIESTVDTATVNRLYDILAIKGITGTRSENVTGGGMNILVGTKGSGGFVENWFNENRSYDEALFDKLDSYVLSVKDNVIAVLGKDTDAAFYGLSTLKLIFEQTADSTVRALQIEDYADGQYRGFIEGFYGIPWTVEDRISLMEFGGDFKMNIYIFAPKDDEYHNSNWRTLYPEDKLEDIRKMVAAGTAAKCRFAWAIHPFMHNQITAANYDESLQIVKDKFQQLYDAGVRQFVISADDAVSNAQVQANLCRDMSQWMKEHEGTYNLVFVPQVYCTAAASWGGGYTVSSYFNYFRNLTDVELMWTGEWVCHPASQNTFTNFKEKTGREAFMWLNWPVNDVNHKRLVMGPAETGILSPGLTDFRGIVTNPLEQAEASKTSLFAIADFAWNTEDFSCFTSWENGFQYIDPGAPEALAELSRHLTNPSPGGITSMGESTALTPYLTAFTNAYNAGEDITESGTALIEQFEKIVAAADEFQENGVNENLKDEMKPWVDSLRYISKACIGYIRTAMGLKANDADAICGNYLSAVNNYKASQRCESPILSGDEIGTQTVEAGAMKIMPFAETMDNAVKEEALAVLNNNFSGGTAGGETSDTASVIHAGLGGFHQGNAANIIDGNDSTFAWFNANVSSNGYVGVDLGDVYRLDNIRVLQGRNDTDGDIFSSSVLEYSMDGENWTSIGNFSGRTVETNVLDQVINARYVRLRTPSATAKWYAIREFTVTTRPVEYRVYTNVDAYREYTVSMGKNTASIPEIEEALALQAGEYIGLEFPNAREITSLTADYTEKDKLTLEYGYNGFEWYPVESSFETLDAKYIRITNKGAAEVSFNLKSLLAESSGKNRSLFAVPEGKEGNAASNAADGSILTSFAAAEGSGELTWRVEAGSADSLYILQDASVMSNAKVMVRTNAGAWKQIGNLSKSLNVFENLLLYGPVNEVKIAWEKNGPVIYEMYTKKEERTEKELLSAIINEAENQESALYSEESYREFVKAATAAKAVLQNASASEAEVKAALESMYAAAGKLILKSEAAEQEKQALAKALTEALNGAKTLFDKGKGKYTEASWNAFTSAYQAASRASGKEDISVLNKLLADLQTAQKGLTEEKAEPPKPVLKKGDTGVWKQMMYRVTDSAKKQAEVLGPVNKLMKTVTIPASVKIKGETCSVTGVANKAFSGMKKLTTVTIGKNVQKIGRRAFYNDKKLKKITIKSKMLKKVAKDALKKTYAKGTIKVPKSKKKAYAKLFKNRGQKKIK